MTTQPDWFEIMRSDHRVVRRLLAELRAIVEAEGGLDRAAAARSVETLLLADQQHHAREEALLRALNRVRPMLGSGPIATIRQEHLKAWTVREQMLGLLEERSDDATEAFLGLARPMIEEMRAHMEREERYLFPFAVEVLDDAQQRAVGEAMAALTQEE